ncbi:leucine-rich repeat receptor-like protein CLAVATA2 [Iris pallida]|uniref:Leucine-rich repeat receptor-like protein CLAVATA2 n=1 Tax=Iris pallida TaxID=29817 RepID=A0AAX6HSL9_IRIPA|nr:leucine-rich repeat receptor-like protein CLAVATA2 [Iris pallida]
MIRSREPISSAPHLQSSRVAPGDPPRTTELGEQRRPQCPDIPPCLADFVVAILLLVEHRSLERWRPSLYTGHMEIGLAVASLSLGDSGVLADKNLEIDSSCINFINCKILYFSLIINVVTNL